MFQHSRSYHTHFSKPTSALVMAVLTATMTSLRYGFSRQAASLLFYKMRQTAYEARVNSAEALFRKQVQPGLISIVPNLPEHEVGTPRLAAKASQGSQL